MKSTRLKTSLFVLCLLILILIAPSGTSTLEHQPAQSPAKPNPSLIGEINSELFADLPVSKIEINEVPNSWGTVIYIPQIHQLPGSSAESSTNDLAEKVQQQIYEILKRLASINNPLLTMVETFETTKQLSILNEKTS